jgi:hypothetical protein
MSETTPQRTEPHDFYSERPWHPFTKYTVRDNKEPGPIGDPRVPRTEPSVPFSAGARRYHADLSMAFNPIVTPNPDTEQDSPEYQDAALARLHAQYDRAHLAFGIVFCVWVVTLLGFATWAIYVFTR